MLLTRVSKLSGVKRTKDLPVTTKQLGRVHSGEPLHEVFSHLAPEEREFLLTGTVKEEWGAFSES